MLIQKKLTVSISEYCPKCDHKLNHVNALDTEAKIYFCWCPNYKCRFCVEFEKKGSGEIIKCL